MKKGLFYLPIVLLCTALFTGYGAKAQDVFKPGKSAVPGRMLGNWALPDCRAYDEALMITRHFYLKSNKDGSQFWPISVLMKKKDYTLLSVEGAPHPARIENDGVLKIGTPDQPVQKWPKTWAALPMDSKREYMGCADIPAILPDPLVRVMVQIDAIESACHATLSKKCTQLLFDIADDNKNRKISLNEMKMAGAMLTGVSILIENHSATRNTLDKAFYESFRESDRIFKTMSPEGNELSYRDFSGFLQTDSVLLKKTLTNIGTVFPPFTPEEPIAPPPPDADDHSSPGPDPHPEYPSPQSP